MKKVLFVLLIVFLLAGCAPKMPDDLKAIITVSYPFFKTLEAKKDSSEDLWCVAYKTDGTDDDSVILVEYYYDETWIMPNEAWARSMYLPGVDIVGGYCD